MKWALSLLLVAGALFWLMQFLRGPIPLAGALGGGAATPSGNGDVNGDGALNLTDAIYVLQHLFQGGPAPVLLSPKGAALPATGQTTCYDQPPEDTPTKEIPCDSADFPGQDGFYQAGCPTEGRFVDNGDGTVTDNCTGLMWQQDTADINGDGEITSSGQGVESPDKLSWQDALKYCENLTFAGHDDWRLPNLRELQSIVDFGRWNPAIDPVFRVAWISLYWSSSSLPPCVAPCEGPFWAWLVSFTGGGSMTQKKDGPYFVRAVRTIQAGGAGTPSGNGDANGDGALNLTDAIYVLQHLFQGGPAPAPLSPKGARLPGTGQMKCYDSAGAETACENPDFPGQDGSYQAGCPTEGRFVDNGDGTVTDNCTGLMWQQDTADVNGDGSIDPNLEGTDCLNWQDALKYCEGLSLADHDDWRLPNVRELLSIVDYGLLLPAMDPVFEVVPDGLVGSWYWTASFLAPSAGSEALCVKPGTGETGLCTKSHAAFFVRAVRTIQPGE